MPLRRSRPGEVADLAAAGGDDLLRQRLLAGAADHPDVEPALDQQPCGAGVIGPALGGADRPRSQRHRGTGAEVVGLPPAGDFFTGTTSCGTGHSGGSGAPAGSASAAFLSMKRAGPLSPQRIRLISPNRASPKSRRRSGMPASAGAIAAFQVRGRRARFHNPGRAVRMRGPTVSPPPTGRAAGPRRCRCGHPACNRPGRAQEVTSKSTGRLGQRCLRTRTTGRGRNRRSTYRARSGSAACRRHPPARSH